jgi:hypothetical protein
MALPGDWLAPGKTAGVRFDRIVRIDSRTWTCHFSSAWRSLQAGLGSSWELTSTLFCLGRCVSRPQGHSETKTADVSGAAHLDSTLRFAGSGSG